MDFFKKLLNSYKAKLLLACMLLASFITAFVLFNPIKLFAQDNDECFGCHDDKTLTGMKGKKTISVFVDGKKINKSVHAGIKCVDCHADLKNVDMPHDEELKKAQCGSCHKEEQALYNECLHGKSYAKGDPLAPTCQSCHGSHEIVPRTDKKSNIYPLNIPQLCGKCHREGSPVQLQRNIPESHILENYSESIHGEGLIKKGLTVSATCASCHSPHRILPHTDSRSTINRNNIAATCSKCHAGIEFVHKKIINGELWKKEAKVLPACVDCHQPHKARKVFYEQNLADAKCRNCHENPKVGKSAAGQSMFVKHSDILESSHAKLACTQCHTAVEPSHDRPCDNLGVKKVDCSSCHTAVGNDYKMSIHGMFRGMGDKESPSCADCHGSHRVLPKGDQNSPTFAMNIPKLCSKCHQLGKKAAIRIKDSKEDIIAHYNESIHGKGLNKSGLTVTATCADCHTAHKELPKNKKASSVHPDNIPNTCGKCHYGVHEKFDNSVHSPKVTKTNKKLPVCMDCHTAHTIKRTDQNDFRNEILTTCGKCHEKIAETYFDTYHGKVSKLGSTKAAKCSDCHGSHSILNIDNPHSTLSRYNIIGTCQKCHPGANKGFVKYLAHATHHDSTKYPILFFTFWGMTLLLLSTFTLSFLHTLLWLPRSIQMRKVMKEHHMTVETADNPMLYQRFSAFNRVLHFVMIGSFLTLAVTGMIVKFSYTDLAYYIAELLGGIENAGFIHRVAATALFSIFILHIYDLFRKKNSEFNGWKDMLFGPDSMIPNKKDWIDLKASFKWFVGKGERPYYGRWTYWEKFDYFAVFWGIFVIGGTGLTLWFPELFTKFFPGWLINVATIIHSDEALLAAGFIFTVHFFNTHFRPEKFPMDTVIFSGQMTLDELRIERPAEYEKIMASGDIDKYMAPPFSPKMLRVLKTFGWIALSLGLILVLWIIWAMIIG